MSLKISASAVSALAPPLSASVALGYYGGRGKASAACGRADSLSGLNGFPGNIEDLIDVAAVVGQPGYFVLAAELTFGVEPAMEGTGR